MSGWAAQSGASVRLEWGAQAVEHLAGDVDCVVVVDVMSFSTCVDVAVARGAHVLPYAWRDAGAQAYARERGAELASIDRRLAQGWSLSPTSLAAVPAGLRLVLPSPNGSSIAFAARDRGVAVLCGGLRNRLATARACAGFGRVLVVACGERWPDGSLRPALEDLVGAGGIVAALGRAVRRLGAAGVGRAGGRASGRRCRLRGRRRRDVVLLLRGRRRRARRARAAVRVA